MTDVLSKPAPPFAMTIPMSAGAMVPVTTGSSPSKQRLDAAVSEVERFGQTIDLTYDQRLAARTNNAQRWIIDYRRTFDIAGFVTGAAACLAGIFGVAGGLPPGVTWTFLAPATLLAGIAGASAMLKMRESLMSRGVCSRNPLQSTEVSAMSQHLRAMPRGEQALVHAYVTDWAARKVSAGHLTPPANEVLNGELDVDIEAHASELRAGRAASLLKAMTREGPKSAQRRLTELSALLSECPAGERRELAQAIKDRLFPNEKCVAEMSADEANALYALLRKAEKDA